MYGLDPHVVNDIFTDSDGDGLTDFEEQIYNTCPFNNDTDGDGLSDFEEITHGSDPLNDKEANKLKSVRGWKGWLHLLLVCMLSANISLKHLPAYWGSQYILDSSWTSDCSKKKLPHLPWFLTLKANTHVSLVNALVEVWCMPGM